MVLPIIIPALVSMNVTIEAGQSSEQHIVLMCYLQM